MAIGLIYPAAANAESFWLVLKLSGRKVPAVIELLEMETMAQCQEQGKYWRSKDPNRFENLDYVCLKGK